MGSHVITGQVEIIEPTTLCGRCGHRADAHRLDDATNVSVVDPSAKFRCVGWEADGHFIETHCDCPDFVVGTIEQVEVDG